MRLNRLKTAASLLVACLPCVALANSEPSDTQYPYFTKQFPERPASFSALGERMREDGVFYRGLALASVFNNASTGVDTGQVGGQAIFINALDLDMGKIAALADTFVHMEGVVFPWHYPRDDSVEFGTFASSYLGGDQYPSHAPGLDPWLSLLTVEKVMFDGALDLEAGKTNLQRYFFTPNCGVDFLCTDSLVKWNTGVPDASTGSLAARMRWNLNPRWAVEVGAQQMREYSSLINHRGWDAFGAGGGTGRFYVGSLSYATDFAQRAYPERYQINYYYADTTITDPLDPSDAHRGTSGIVFKHQRTLWSSTARRVRLPTEIPSNVSWFGTIEHSSDTAKPVSWGVTQGLAWTKPWCERPGIDVDQVTLKLMYLHLNDSTLDAQRALRVSLGGRDQGTEADTWRLELSTTLGLTPRLKLQPAVEYIVNPDSAISRTSPELPRSGWLLGVTLALSRAMLPDLTTTRKNP